MATSATTGKQVSNVVLLTTVDNQTARAAEAPPPAADPVAADVQRILTEEGARVRQVRRFLWWTSTAYAAAAALVLAYHFGFHHSPGLLASFQPVMWALLAVRWSMCQRQREAGAKLVALDDPRAIGPLADVLSTGYKDSAAVARTALKQLLSRMNASDGHALTAGQRATLNQLLRRRGRANLGGSTDDSLACAILKAWEQVGDADAVESVRYVADHARSPKLAQAAREALPAIEQRAAAEQARTTLLRPATGSGDSDVLMCPAASTDDAPAHLLRAAAGGADGEA